MRNQAATHRVSPSSSDSTLSHTKHHPPAQTFISINRYPQRAGRVTNVNQAAGEILVTADTLPMYSRMRTLTDKYKCQHNHVFNETCFHREIKLNTVLTYQPLNKNHIRKYCNSRKQLSRPERRELSDFMTRLFEQLEINQLELFIIFTVLFTRFQMTESQPTRTRLDDACFIAAIITQKKYAPDTRLCEPELDYIELHFPTNMYNHLCILELQPWLRHMERSFLQTINSRLHISRTEFNRYYDFFQATERRHQRASNSEQPPQSTRETLTQRRIAIRDKT